VRQNGDSGQVGFSLTGGVFNFSIDALEPNTYDGLLFVTVYERDGRPTAIAAR
jgi:hypothetical protein